jgi:hypothetical protein
MENKISRRFYDLLDSLAAVYNISSIEFIKIFIKLPKPVLTQIVEFHINNEKYKDTELEDLSDYSNEVFFYYKNFVAKNLNNRLEEESKKYKTFTLRNPDDLKSFEVFLDKMILLLRLSPAHFIEILPQCPTAYWDKIDDLRETSYKLQRDSEEYIRCLEKCKIISFAYSNYTDPKEEEEEFLDEDDFSFDDKDITFGKNLSEFNPTSDEY